MVNARSSVRIRLCVRVRVRAGLRLGQVLVIGLV